MQNNISNETINYYCGFFNINRHAATLSLERDVLDNKRWAYNRYKSTPRARAWYKITQAEIKVWVRNSYFETAEEVWLQHFECLLSFNYHIAISL